MTQAVDHPPFQTHKRGSRRSAHHPKSPHNQRRFLTKRESNMLREGTVPSTVDNWRMVKLSRRQRHWLRNARRIAAEARSARMSMA